MRGWLKRVRGVLGMGVTWGGVGALAGMAIEFINGLWPNPIGTMMDMWPVALGLPAFLTGITFSSVLVLLGRSRRFEELSFANFAMLGGLGGLIVAILPWPLVGLGLVPVGFNLWPVVPSIIVAFTMVGATVAPGTLALARLSEQRRLPQTPERAGEIDPIATKTHESLREPT